MTAYATAGWRGDWQAVGCDDSFRSANRRRRIRPASAGNLIFGGTLEGVVFALNARNDERLWYFYGDERVYAAPVSHLAIGDLLVTSEL